MSKCADQRIAQKLYLYELGLLSEDEQLEVEIHLLKCETCFREFQQFKDTAQLLRSDPDIQTDMGELAAGSAETRQLPAASSRWKSILPTALVAAAALVILLLKPWKFEIGPTQEAQAVESYLAIMYFDNIADRADSLHLGEIATNLLITDLSESAYLRVLSGQRLYDLSKLLGQEDPKPVNRETAKEIADSARADILLMGTILQVKPTLIVSTQLIDPRKGDVAAAQQVSGNPGEDIFAVVDRLSTQIKHDLSLPAAAIEEPDPLIAEITTHSADAYRAYLRGMDLKNKHYTYAAIEEFRKALDYDSTFAMAYYRLSQLADQSLITRAVHYSDHVSTRERFLINCSRILTQENTAAALTEIERGLQRFPDDKEMLNLAATFNHRLQRYTEAIDYHHQVLKVDPLYKMAYNELAYLHDILGQYELAIDAINKYIRMAPDEANPYDTRGEIYARNGKVDLAIESFSKALSLRPDYRNSRNLLGHIALIQGKYDVAEKWYRALAEDREYTSRVMGRMFLAQIPTYQGKLSEALRILDEGIAKDAEENPIATRHLDTGFKHYSKAWIYLELGEYDRAVEEFQTHMEIYREASPNSFNYDRDEYIQLLAEAGRIEQAEQLVEEYERDLIQKGYPQSYVAYARGCIAFAKADYSAAIDHLTVASRAFNNFPSRYMLARAYQANGRLSDAVSEFEVLLDRYSVLRECWAFWSVRIHYYLGMAYEESQWNDRAIEQYTIFLDTWEHADFEIPELADAARRLDRLRPKGDSGSLP